MKSIVSLVALLFAMAALPVRADLVGYYTNGSSLFTFDISVGPAFTSQPITNQQSLNGLAYYTPSGSLLSIDGFNDVNSDRLFAINPTSGIGSTIGNTGFNWNFRSLEYDANNNLLWGATDNRLYSLNPLTGAANLVSNITSGGNPLSGQLTAIAIQPTTNDMYFTTINGSNTSLYSVDAPTGVATFISNKGSTASFQWSDIAFAPNGGLYGANFDGKIWDLGTGIGNALPTTLDFSDFGTAHGLAFANVSAVPEPSSLVLFGVSAIGFIAYRRRKRDEQSDEPKSRSRRF